MKHLIEFYKLSYMYQLATPMCVDSRGIINGDSTLQLFDILACQMDLNTGQ